MKRIFAAALAAGLLAGGVASAQPWRHHHHYRHNHAWCWRHYHRRWC
ncbi:MAG TPA: hypothetical protein VGG92_08245 [Caulobacteraceae bacterium]|jgi:hypothetical protein